MTMTNAEINRLEKDCLEYPTEYWHPQYLLELIAKIRELQQEILGQPGRRAL